MANITPDQRIESLEATRNQLSPDHRAGHIERAYDRRDSRFIGGISIFSMLVAGVVGASVGMVVMLFVDQDLWWAGALIGFFSGGVIGAFVPARFALEQLDAEARPPQETTTAADSGRPHPR